MYIYIVYSFCTTLPIAWQSICDLRSCKAMTLVRVISWSCHFIYFFSMCFFFLLFFSLWHHLFQLEVREGAAIQRLRWTELEHWIWLFFNDIFHLASLSVSSQVQQCLLSEKTGNISGTVRGERRRNILSMDMQHPVDNRRTDGPAHRPAEPRADGQTMMTKRWDGPPSPCPREREMALILAWWHTTGQPLGC